MKGLTWSPTPSVQGPCAPRRARTGRCPEPGKETALGLHRGAHCAQRSQRGAIREAARDRGPACRAPHPKALAKAKPRRELPARPPSSFLCPPRLPAEACPTPSPSARVARGVVGLRLCTNVHPSTWTERHACVRTSHHTVTEPDPGRSPGLHKPGDRTGPGHETPPRAPSSGWQSRTPPRSPRRAGALQVPPPRAQGRARPGRVWGGTELNSHSLSKQVVWAAAARHPLPRPAQDGAAGPSPGSWSDPEAPGTARPGASGTWEPPPDLGGRGSCSLGLDEHPSSLATAALHPAAPHSTARAPRPSGDRQACWARIARLRGAAVADGPAARGCPCRAPGPRVIGPAAWAMTSSGAAATSAPF